MTERTTPKRRKQPDAGLVERAKFDLGTKSAPAEEAAPRLEGGLLPWGYAEDRLTALVRSPDSLYVYWEITDAGIQAARSRLGPAGDRGWFNLRVYDTTARDFDGTNANHYFDLGVDRSTRESFLALGRPNSSAHVEIGIKTHEGFFQAIARSGRADFPRRSPSPNSSLEWMTVTAVDDSPAARPYHSRHAGPEPPLPAVGSPPADPSAPAQSGPATRAWTTEQSWTVEEHASTEWINVTTQSDADLIDIPGLFRQWRTEWRSGLRFLRWAGGGETRIAPDQVVSWSEGPFLLPFTDPERVDLQGGDVGPMLVSTEWGPVEVFGPWRVTIRGFERQPERRVLASWTMHWVHVTPLTLERWITPTQRRMLSGYARERLVFAGSEALRLRELGASEMWSLGASERMWLGASAWMALGASEVFGWGASIHVGMGASEWLFRGASERMALGASEAMSFGLGGSEQLDLFRGGW
jgi:hypothetical protein